MSQRELIAKRYFEAFHAGRIDEILGYFTPQGTVQYGKEPAKEAEAFFVESKDLIASLSFTTHGIYSSEDTTDVLIHFSYAASDEEGNVTEVEAVDIIEFDGGNQIKTVRVIPNS